MKQKYFFLAFSNPGNVIFLKLLHSVTSVSAKFSRILAPATA